MDLFIKIIAVAGLGLAGFVVAAILTVLGLALATFVAVTLGKALLRGRAGSSGGPIPGASRLTARVSRMKRPTLLLTPAKAGGFSKLGGAPELPDTLDWPEGSKGPRMFLAQVDLAAVHACAPIDWLPAEGRLYAFGEFEDYGWPDQVRVIYSLDDPQPPAPPSKDARAFRERRVDFQPYVSLPSLEWLDAEDGLDVDFEAFEARLDALGARPPGENMLHRIGGYPDEIQGGCLRLECEHLARGLPPPDYADEPSPAIDRASREWRLLMQIDSDPELGMNFGDAGRFYVFIRERHARAADFSKTVTLFQCY